MSSNETSINDFGLLIAFVLPGYTALFALSYLTDTLDPLLTGPAGDAPAVGGFLILTIASIAVGITISTIRWLVIDRIHHKTGIPPPAWDFSVLKDATPGFEHIVRENYRYFQFYANSLVALVGVFVARRWSMGFLAPVDAADLGLGVLAVIFFIGSRDALRRYYTRGSQLLRLQRKRR